MRRQNFVWRQHTKIRTTRRSSRLSVKGGFRPRRAAFEVLEERAMLSVAQDLQAQIQPYQSAINSTLSASTSLPLVGHQIESLQQVTTLLENTLAELQQATQGLADGHHQIAIALTTISHSFAFDLGLDALLQVKTAGEVSGSLTPTLNIAFDVSGASATLDVAHTNLDLGFRLTLPGFQAAMSLNHLLYTHAVDQGSNFDGHLLFGFDAGGGVTPQFSGDAHVRLGLSLSFVDPALGASFNPTFRTDFQLDWGIDTASNELDIPQIALKNFSLDVDSFTHNFLGDIVTSVQKYTKPLQPFIDTFETPVPIVSAFDSSETIGDLLLQGAGLSPDLQDRFELMVKVIKAVNTFDLSGSTGGAAINFGDINLTGLSVTGAGQLGDVFGFDTSQLQNAIQQIIDSPALQDLQDTLEDVANYAGVNAQAGFQFPVLEDPGPVIGGILTGQARDMFTFTTGREHFELAPSIGFGIPDLFGVFLTAGITLDADFSVGYDTAGLIKFVQDPLHQPEDLLHGFYFDNSIDTSGPPIPNVSSPRKTAFYLQGFAEISASAVVTVTGGIHANVAIELVNQDNSSHVYLDTMLQNIGSPANVFNASGQLYAAASIELTIPNPVGPNITLFSYELAHKTLLDYDPPPPASETKPLVVIDVTNEHTLQLKTAQMSAVGQVTVQPFHNMSVLIAGQIVVADGIRVDYAGEIDLYIERKNDFTTNYYNLVGLDGPAPDGVSIHIIDPFRVFADEGAPDPEPAQTSPGVILVGGRNVTYDYSEAGDGTHATVLLAGGYGSSTLTGGTMEFGNFIPAERLDQAKQHYGNVSGFDSAGQTIINSQIDAAVAPADPTGIIGSTMTASHGGLMFGGPGNNSVFAAGPGAYEMIGGTWYNTFNISPSFGGVPATYQIDGGPFGQSQLVVRVPAGDTADFENGTVPDKYDPSTVALDIYSNAGLFATAHGIKSVHAVGAPGSTVTFGDTSLLNIDFKVTGAAKLKFGGTAAADTFGVTATGNFFSSANRRGVPLLVALDYTRGQMEMQPDWYVDFVELSNNLVATPFAHYHFENISSGTYIPVQDYAEAYFGGPIYSVARVFGTNGHSQTITFQADNTKSSSITLDGGGSSDTYSVEEGVATFLDVEVQDSGLSSQNNLQVGFHDNTLIATKATLSDYSLELEYYTPLVEFYWAQAGFSYQHFYTSSAAYTPKVSFSANTLLTFATSSGWGDILVDRHTPTNNATILFDNVVITPTGPGGPDNPASPRGWPPGFSFTYQYIYGRFNLNIYWELSQPASHPVLINGGGSPQPPDHAVGGNPTVDVQANAGSLTIEGLSPQRTVLVNIHGNTGTIDVQMSRDFTGDIDTFNVFSNSGVLNFDYATTFPTNHLIAITHRINVFANTGTINSTDSVANAYTGLNESTFSAQINVGTDGLGGVQNLSNVHGTINLLGENGYQSLNLDDRNRAGTSPSWLIATTQTQIADLTINYDIYGVGFQAFWKTGTPVTYRDNVQFTFKNLNGLTTYPNFPLEWYLPSLIQNLDGESVTLNLSDYFGGQPPSGTTTYGATNLPPGLSLNSATGLISGTIPFNSYPGSPFAMLVSATNGQYTRQWTLEWDVSSAIYIYPSFYSGVGAVNVDETSHVSFDPISVSDSLNLTPVVTVTGLPPGLAFDPNTLVISGTVPAGASTHGLYDVHIHADDGIETADVLIPMIVSGIQLASATEVRLNHSGDAVNFNLNATTTSGGTLTYSATGLPAGITLNAATGQITGTLAANANTQSPYYVEITYNDGYSTKADYLTWTVLQTGVTDEISLLPISSQSNSVGDIASVQAKAATSLSLPIQFLVQGLPPGLTFSYTPFYFNGYASAYIYGTVPAAAALNSPYHVTITATNGLDSVSVSFDWQITGPQPPELLGDFDGSGVVDQTDYGIWRGSVGQSVTPYTMGDGNGDGHVDAADYVVWRKHLGQSLGGGAAIAVATQESITTAAPVAPASTSISSSLTPLKLPTVSSVAVESHAAIFEDLEFTLPQRAADHASKHASRWPFEGPSRQFLNGNLLMMADGRTRLGPHPRHSESETARFCDEPSEDAGVVDQALEELSVAVESQRWIL